MNEIFITKWVTSLQPMMDVAEINRKAVQKLTSLQTKCMTDCFNASLEQFKSLAEAQDPQAATELQMQFFKDMDAKLTNTAEQEVEAVNESQKAVTEVMGESYAHMTDMTFFKEVSDALAPLHVEAEVTSTEKDST
jgi:phasin family protein